MALAAGRDINYGPLVDVQQETEAYRRFVSERYLVPVSDFDARETERQALILGIGSEGSQWWWWQADAWSGKTTAMADLFLRPPPRWSTIAFFIRQNESDSAADFLRCALPQAASICAIETLEIGVDLTSMAAKFSALLTRAAEDCLAAGRQLVVLIDGLDEESTETSARHPILSMLPRYLPAGSAVVAASRANPSRVSSDHPLLANRHDLAPSPRAEASRDAAVSDVRALLNDRIGREIGALLYIAEGIGLTARDFATLSRHKMWEIDATLSLRIGRSFSAFSKPGFIIRDDEIGVTRDTAYVWAHSTLQEEFARLAGPALRQMSEKARLRVRKALKLHQREEWPDETPSFLLGIDCLRVAYATKTNQPLMPDEALLILADPKRGTALYRRGLALSDTLATLLESAEKLAERDSLGKQDLTLAGRLLFTYQQLVKSADVPTGMPGIFLRLGWKELAVHLAESTSDPQRRQNAMLGLCLALAEVGDVDGALAKLPELRSGDKAAVLAPIVEALIESDQLDRAETIAAEIHYPYLPHKPNQGLAWFAYMLVRSGRVDEAVEVSDRIGKHCMKRDYFATLAEKYAALGEERLALEAFLRVRWRQAEAAANMVNALAGAENRERSVSLIESVISHWDATPNSSGMRALELIDRLQEKMPLEIAERLATKALTDPPRFYFADEKALFFARAAGAFGRAGSDEQLEVAANECLDAISVLSGAEARWHSLHWIWLKVGIAAKLAASGRVARASVLVRQVASLLTDAAPEDRASAVFEAVTRRLAGSSEFAEVIVQVFERRVAIVSASSDSPDAVQQLLRISRVCAESQLEDLSQRALRHAFALVEGFEKPADRAIGWGTLASVLAKGSDEEVVHRVGVSALVACRQVESLTIRAQTCVVVAENLLAASLRAQAEVSAQLALAATQARGAWSPTAPASRSILEGDVQDGSGADSGAAGSGTDMPLIDQQFGAAAFILNDSEDLFALVTAGRFNDALSLANGIENTGARVVTSCMIAKELAAAGRFDEAGELARGVLASVGPGGEMVSQVAILGAVVETLVSSGIHGVAEEAAARAESLIVDFAEPHDLDLAWREVCVARARLGNTSKAWTAAQNIQNWQTRALALARAAFHAKGVSAADGVRELALGALASLRPHVGTYTADLVLLEVSLILVQAGVLEASTEAADMIRDSHRRELAVDRVVQEGMKLQDSDASTEVFLSLYSSMPPPQRRRLLTFVGLALASLGEPGKGRRVIARSWLLDPMLELDTRAWAAIDFDGDVSDPWKRIAPTA